MRGERTSVTGCHGLDRGARDAENRPTARGFSAGVTGVTG